MEGDRREDREKVRERGGGRERSEERTGEVSIKSAKKIMWPVTYR